MYHLCNHNVLIDYTNQVELRGCVRLVCVRCEAGVLLIVIHQPTETSHNTLVIIYHKYRNRSMLNI